MNKINKDWKEVKLGDIVDITMGQSPKSEFYNKRNEGMPFLQGSATFGFMHPYFETYSSDIKKIAINGSVLMSVRAPVGDLNIANADVCIGRGLCSINGKSNIINRYIFYLLSYYKPKLLNMQKGTTFGAITKDDILNFKVLIAEDIEEQKRIASALSKIDAYLENTIKLIEEKERFKRGIAKKLLTCKEGENIPEARFKGFEDEWEIVKLGDITKMISGGTPNTKIKEYYNGNIVWATITDITNSYKYLYDSEKKITELGLQNSSTKIFPINTVLYSIYGSIGECAISKVECTTNQAILGIECSDKINYNFLYYLLSNHKNNAKKLRQFGTQPNINKKIVLNFCFKIPNIEEQEKIGGYLSLLDAEIDNLKKQKELIKEMKKGAMQKLLSGEIRLSKNAFNENI